MNGKRNVDGSITVKDSMVDWALGLLKFIVMVDVLAFGLWQSNQNNLTEIKLLSAHVSALDAMMKARVAALEKQIDRLLDEK